MPVSPATISALSKDYVRTGAISAREAGAPVDPSGDAVQMAFVRGSTDPVSGDWKAASWDTDATTTPDTYRAQCLIGPGGVITLIPGVYSVWVKITDSPEIPVLQSGSLRVY